MTRLTPFDVAFAELSDGRFPAVRQEAEESRRNLEDRAQFASLSTVQHILADVESPEIIEQEPAAAVEYLTSLYVAFRFWNAGRLVFPIEREDIETALAIEPPATLPDIPRGACYVQLPEQLIWAQVGPDRPHEPVDGLFIVDAQQPCEITVLAVLGLRRDRAGFSQVTVTASPSDALAARSTARTPPFAPVLEGGERTAFKSLVTAGELLHLTQLALLHVNQ